MGGTVTSDVVGDLLDALDGPHSLGSACDGLLGRARSMLGADVAGLVAWDARGRVEQLASTDPEATAALCELRGGPLCPPAAALPDDAVLAVGDTWAEDRWPGWASQVAGLGHRSVLLVNLPSLSHRPMALHAWAARPHAFGDAVPPHTVDFVRLAGLMVAQAERVENLVEALQSRSLIAQAQGIVMERFSVGADEAMAYLRRVSQDQQLRVRDLAATLVGGRNVPRPAPRT